MSERSGRSPRKSSPKKAGSPKKSSSPQKWKDQGFKSAKEHEQWKIENRVTSDHFERNHFWEILANFTDWAIYEMPPGPAFIPFRYNVNFAKGGMPFLIFAMMVYYNNFSTAAWMYFCLHGSYGIFWVFRDVVFPDPNFLRVQTVASMIMPWPIALFPYFIPCWEVMSRRVP